MFTLPGTPVIRYGDELGMGDDLTLPERNCARTPMQWSTEPNGGFTKSEKPIMPVISEGPYGFRAHQRGGAAARSRIDAQLDGAHHPHAQGSSGDRLGRLRSVETRATRPCWPCATTGAITPCCSCTTSTRSRARSRSRRRLTASERQAARQSADRGSQPSRRAGKHRIVLEGYGYRWYRVGGLDYLLKRTDI